MDEIITSKIIGIKPTNKEIVAYYMTPKNGGFQLHRMVVEEDVVLEDKPFSDPDAWDQVLSVLESELSKKFQ